MEPIRYVVSRIDGDYAILLREGTEDTILVARALLPEEIDEGVHLLYDFLTLSYTIL